MPKGKASEGCPEALFILVIRSFEQELEWDAIDFRNKTFFFFAFV